MSGEVIELKGRPPAALAKRLGDATPDDLSAGVTGGYGVLSFRASKWRVKYEGEEVPLVDNEGDAIPSIKVVLLKANRHISKNYYGSKYVEGSSDAPDCFSLDGERPDPAAPHKQNELCATCPKNRFGSRVTDEGKKAKACSDNRRLVIIPEGDFANERFGGPMLLRIPPTSLLELKKFGELVKRAGGGHNYNTIITRLSFDMDASYPKLQFKAVRPLTDEEGDEIGQLLDDPEFQSKMEAILSMPVEVHRTEDEEDEEENVFEEPAKKAAPAKKKAKAKPKKKVKAEEEEVEDDKPEPESDELDDDLKDILSSLDNLD